MMECKNLTSMLFALVVLASPMQAEAADAVAGKAMFDMVCSYCHKSDYEDKYGPGLQGIMDRVDAAWLDRWLADPVVMVKTDEYAKALRESNSYDLTMPAIPAMKDPEARANMIEFLKTLQ